MSKLLAQFFDIHAERILRSDGNVKIQHAGAPQEALQVFGVIKHRAQRRVGVEVDECSVDLCRGGGKLSLELRYRRATIFALLCQLRQCHHARPATGGERAGLHLGALFVVSHLGSGGSFRGCVKVSALLACSNGSVVGSATVARGAPERLQLRQFSSARCVALGQVNGLALRERGVQFARRETSLGEQCIKSIRIRLLGNANFVTRKWHHHFDAIFALRRHGQVQNTLRIHAVFKGLNRLLEQF